VVVVYGLRIVQYGVVMASLLSLGLAQQAQAADDAWWGKDKQAHFFVSSGIAAATYLWLGQSQMEPFLRMGVSTGVVLGLGAIKEVWDVLGHGHPSWKDMTWNVIGSVVGLVVAWVVEYWLWPKAPRGAPLRVAF